MKLRALLLSFSLLAPIASVSSAEVRATGRAHKDEPAPISVDRAQLRTALAARREVTIARFLAYRERKVYPVGMLPGGGFHHVWRDDQGNLCAAATLLAADWGKPAAEKIGAANVELKLAAVTSGPVADWMLSTGLTHHELVAIQVPGWEPQPHPSQPEPKADPQARAREVERLYGIYVDVERQLTDLADESLDELTDAVMKRPDLARQIIAGQPAARS